MLFFFLCAIFRLSVYRAKLSLPLSYELYWGPQAREEELAQRLREMEVAAVQAPETRDLVALRPDLEQVSLSFSISYMPQRHVCSRKGRLTAITRSICAFSPMYRRQRS